MHRRTLLLAPFALAAAPAPVAVVASFSILADFAAQVGGDAVSVSALVLPDGDAHTFQPRPSDLGRLKNAAVIVENGLGLEPWLARLVRSSGFRGQRIVAAAGVTPRNFQEGGKTVADPHCWQDPRNAARMVATIAQGLATADPAHADAYRQRADAFAAEILQQDAANERSFAAIPPGKRQIITSHDAFGYYAARYGIVLRAVQGISTEGEPSARDIAGLIDKIRRERVHAVFIENMSSHRLTQAVARETGAVIGDPLYADALSPQNGPAPSYLAMLRHNTMLLAAAMGTNPD